MDGDTFLYIVTSITFAVIFLFCYINSVFGYFQRKNVPSGPTPTFPFGNISDVVFKTVPLALKIHDLFKYSERKKFKFAGVFALLKPIVLITDPKLFSKINKSNKTNSDYQYHCLNKNDEINLVEDNKQEINIEPVLLKYFENYYQKTIIDTEDVNNFSEILKPSFRFLQLLSIFYSSLTGDKLKYLESMIEEEINYRKKTDVKKEDLLQKLIENNENIQEMTVICYKHLKTLIECVLPSLLFCLHELCLNEEVQNELRDEIKRLTKEGPVTSVLTSPYLDTVVKETLRKYPPTPYYVAHDVNLSTLHPELQQGSILFSIYSLHYSPSYFANPESFDPDRFSEENIHFIHESTYLPFYNADDLIPEYANHQIKLALCKLLHKNCFTLGKKAHKNIHFDTNEIIYLKPKDGLSVVIKKDA